MSNRINATLVDAFCSDVARDLQRTPKVLQSKYLYDALGSSLFDAICRLPWYRITRAEAMLLARHAREIAAAAQRPGDLSVVELGCGNGEKLETIIAALASHRPVAVHLIDIAADALKATSERLSRFPHVMVHCHQGTYQEGLRALGDAGAGGNRLALFLGSNIGNFDRGAAGELLGAIRAALAPQDLLLLGADLVKPAADLILAYDDPLGVTAAFNRNLLVRMNRELGAAFDLRAFDHRAVWNQQEQRIEMHLVSRVRQEVEIPAAGIRVRFAAGESIWTESSYKYSEGEIAAMGSRAGFRAVAQFVDADARFALTLLAA